MAAAARARLVAAGLGSWGEVAALAGRAARRTARQPAAWLPGILVPLVVAAVFTADYGRVADMIGFPSSASYLRYVLPATLLVGSVYVGIVAGTEATTDVENGFIYRVLLTPAWRPGIAAGVLSVAAAQAAVQSCAIIAIFGAFGAGIGGGAVGGLAVLAAAVLVAVAVAGVAVAIGLRTGDSEVMQSLFGVLLILLFVSSAFFPPTDMRGWFRTVAEHSPLTTIADGMRAEVLGHHAGARAPVGAIGVAALLCAVAAMLALGALRARGGWYARRGARPPRRGARSGRGYRRRRAVVRRDGDAGTWRAPRERQVGGVMMAAIRVAFLIGCRNVLNVFRIPGNVVTVIGLPVLVLIIFSGAFGGVASLAGFPAPNSLSWVAPYAVVMGAAFAGLGSAYDVARDVQSGFMDRLLIAPAARVTLVFGEVLGSVGRAWMQLAAVLAIAIPSGAIVGAGMAGAIPLLVLASAGIATWSGLWALAVLYRFPAAQSIGLVTAGIVAASLLTTGQVPLHYQTAWLRAVASANPMTPVLEMSRQGFAGPVTWSGTWPGLVALIAATVVLVPLTWASLRRLGRGAR